MNPRIDPKPETAAARPRRSRLGAALRWLLFGLLTLIGLLLLAIVALRWLPPPTTAYMLQSPVKPVRYQWVPAAEIADAARRAVVASEDQKFWTHDGFDVEAIQKAYADNQKNKHRIRGASTISQQTAKNLFLWPGGGYFRKGVEALLTVLIEKLWGKQRILEMYLNVVELGPGIYGVEAASQVYYGKPASKISAEEAARLAAVLPNPRHWHVRPPGPYVQARTSWILGQIYGTHGTAADEPDVPDSEIDEDRRERGGSPGSAGPPTVSIPSSREPQPASEPEPATRGTDSGNERSDPPSTEPAP